MSWVVTNKQDAAQAGADLKQDRVMLVITPNYVAERYDDHTADSGPGTPSWEQLPTERRDTLLKAVDAYCDKQLLEIDNAISTIFMREQQDLAPTGNQHPR